jgi:hypothetical protein
LFDPALALRVKRALTGVAELEAAPVAADREVATSVSIAGSTDRASRDDGALGLLALFQREGRLVDFLKQDIEKFGDAEIGAAARVVHAGCRKALLGHFDVVRIRTEAEGAQVTVPEGFDGQRVKLVGNVRGAAPYRGVLRHGGWHASGVRLPEKVAGYDASIIVPAEIEL